MSVADEIVSGLTDLADKLNRKAPMYSIRVVPRQDALADRYGRRMWYWAEIVHHDTGKLIHSTDAVRESNKASEEGRKWITDQGGILIHSPGQGVT